MRLIRTIKEIEKDIQTYNEVLGRMIKRGCKQCDAMRYRMFIADLEKELDRAKQDKIG